MKSAPTPYSIDSLLEHEPFVRAILRPMVQGEDQLHDLVQETWLRAMKRPPTQGKPVRGWLATVARNLARDSHRKRVALADREQRAAKSEVVDAEVAANRLELHQEVVTAVLSLKDPYKNVVLLTYFDGMTAAQVAEKLGTKEATVRSQLHRAQAMLKTKLDSAYGEERGAWLAIGMPWLIEKDSLASLSLGSTGAATTTGGLGLLGAAMLFASVGLVGWLVSTLVQDRDGTPETQDLDSTVAVFERSPQGGPVSMGAGEPVADPAVTHSNSQPADSPSATMPRSSVSASAPLQTVRVLHQGKPVHGIEAWYFDPESAGIYDTKNPEQFSFLTLMERAPTQIFEFAKKSSTVASTDELGMVQLPILRPGGTVLVKNKSLAGLLPIPLETADPTTPAIGVGTRKDPIVVEVFGQRELTVRTVDPNGLAIGGVPVALYFENLPAETQYGWESSKADHATTDPRMGAALFQALEVFQELQTGSKSRWSAKCEIPGIPFNPTPFPEEGSLDPRNPRDPNLVTLKVYATGGLNLHLLDQAGQPVLEPANVQLTAVKKGGLRFGPTGYANSKRGLVRFPHVGVSAQFEATITFPSGRPPMYWKGFGPLESQEKKSIQVKATPGIRVTGQLTGLDASRVLPVPHYHLLFLAPDGKIIQREPFLVKSDGTIDFQFTNWPDEVAQVQGEILSDFAFVDTNVRHRIPLGVITQNPQAGLTLGNVPIQTAPLAVQGRLVNEEGDGVPGVDLSFAMDEPQRSYSGESDAEGKFSFQGRWPEKPKVEIRADSGWFLLHPGKDLSGPDHHEIVLGPVGSIEGNFEDPVKLDKAISMIAYPVDERGEVDRETYCFTDQNLLTGKIRFPHVPPGQYLVETRFYNHVLTAIPDVFVRSGEVTQDPRMQGMPSAFEWTETQWDIRTPKGKPLRHATVQAYAGANFLTSAYHESPQTKLLTPKSVTTHFIVSATGYRPNRIDANQVSPGTTHTVHLKSGLPVRLIPDHPLELQRGKRSVRLSLNSKTLEGSRIHNSVSLPSAIGKGEEVTVVLPAPGTYFLTSSTTFDGPNNLSTVSMNEDPLEIGGVPIEIEVEETRGEQTIALPLPNSVLN